MTRRKKPETHDDDDVRFFAERASWLADRCVKHLETIIIKDMEIERLKEKIKQLEGKK